MDKLATVVVVLFLSVVGSCSELKEAKDETKLRPIHEPRRAEGLARAVGKPAALKPKLLPLKVVSETGEPKKKSTEDILRHIGMSKMKSAANNHRKRLASQSRKSHNEKHLQDSHVYVIKLPPSRFYYDQDQMKPNKLHQQQHPASINHIPLDFKSNGKPGKIYHWNLPVVKKMVARKTGGLKLAKEHDANQVMKPGPLWPSPEEETPAHYRRISYFKPKKPSKQAFHKFFPGNGKPHSLYVIERSKRPVRRVPPIVKTTH